MPKYTDDEIRNIMGLNMSILKFFDDMENPIPKWYR